jgi:hypothetical protein
MLWEQKLVPHLDFVHKRIKRNRYFLLRLRPCFLLWYEFVLQNFHVSNFIFNSTVFGNVYFPPLVYLLIYFFFFYYCCAGGTLWHLQRFLPHIIVELNTSIILLYPSSPIPRIVSKGLILSFTYMCTQYRHYIHPPTFSPHIPLHTLVPVPQTGPILPLCSLFS